MFNPSRLVPKYNSIKTISNFNKNKKLYQQILYKNKKRDYNKILKRNVCSSSYYGTGGGGGGGDGNDYWKLIAMAVSVYFVTNSGKPPPPTPLKNIQWFPLNKKYT
jgi:hypothetical protein